MALRFVNKKISREINREISSTKIVEEYKPIEDISNKNEEKPVKQLPKVNVTVKNKKEKKEDKMTTMEAVMAAETAVENMAQEVKIVKKDRELIERAESSKIVLTEDNRQVLND